MKECPNCKKIDGVVFKGIFNDGGRFKDTYECINCENKWEEEVTKSMNQWITQG